MIHIFYLKIIYLLIIYYLLVVLRGSISYNTEFQRPLQYKLELRHLPDNYTFMVMEDAMYSVQGFEVNRLNALSRTLSWQINLSHKLFK